MGVALLALLQALASAPIARAGPTPIPRATPPPELGDAAAAAAALKARRLGGEPPIGVLRALENTSVIELPSSTKLLPTAAYTVEGQPSPTHSSGAGEDSLLAIMPDFAFSMPAQVIVDGVNIALISMLAIHLLFTMRYHYPLSSRNYLLQAASVLVLLMNYSVHLHVILARLRRQSMQWPYMFAYIGTKVPPDDNSWNTAKQAFYLLMRAFATALAHLTHIQFLTLLFPSSLEARLIFWMLGPLALVASGMEFTALSPNDDVKTSDLGDAIRNICNSTLYLLYTSALLIWGLLVNRRRAWRTDGGTAAFGAGSVGLAVINTTVSFVEIAYDRLWWLPDICWSLTVWQSWLGFWWWVGAGMGIGEVEDRAERLARRRRREEKLQRKREKEELREERARAKAAGLPLPGDSGGGGGGGVGAESSDVLINGFRRLGAKIASETKDAGNTLNRRLRRGGAATTVGQGEDLIELEEVRTHVAPATELEAAAVAAAAAAEGVRDGASAVVAEDARTTAGSGSSDSQPTGDTSTVGGSGGGSSSSGGGVGGWMGSVVDWLAIHQPEFVRLRLRRLRMAHAAAARRAATEQTLIREQVLNAHGERAPGLRTMIIERGGGGGGGGGAGGSTRPSSSSHHRQGQRSSSTAPRATQGAAATTRKEARPTSASAAVEARADHHHRSHERPRRATTSLSRSRGGYGGGGGGGDEGAQSPTVQSSANESTLVNVPSLSSIATTSAQGLLPPPPPPPPLPSTAPAEVAPAGSSLIRGGRGGGRGAGSGVGVGGGGAQADEDVEDEWLDEQDDDAGAEEARGPTLATGLGRRDEGEDDVAAQDDESDDDDDDDEGEAGSRAAQPRGWRRSGSGAAAPTSVLRGLVASARLRDRTRY